MRKLSSFTYSLLVLFILLTIPACRRQEQAGLPTAVPTIALPDRTATAVPQPTTATASPTAVPQPTAAPLFAVDPAAIDWPPQLVFSSPAPGEEALLNGAITVRFDQPMNKTAVEAAFAVTDEAGQRVAGEFTWTRDDTLVFTPRSLKRQASYRVQIQETASGANGRTLNAPITLQLQTVGYLQVSQTLPAGDSRDVDSDSAIAVFFNRPVVPLVSTAQQASLPQPLTFDPPISGQGEWVSSSIYRFVPATPLDAATTYQVSVADGLTDITGGLLEGGYSWRFSTRSPQVVSIEPPANSYDVNPTLPITITFNTPMDRASTEASVLLPGVGVGNTAVSYQWLNDDRVLVLKPQQPLRLETDYQVTISTGARAARGQANLPRNVVSPFRTVSFPAILYTNPANNEMAHRYQWGFNINFASPMDINTLEGRLRIEPAPRNPQYYFETYNNSLYVSFPLERNTTYRVTVPGDAADPYGNTLGRDYTWQFTTPDYDPIASFNLPQQISQLSTSFPTQVEVQHRNVSRLNVALYNLRLPLNLIINRYDLYNYRPATEPERTWNISPENRNGLATIALADGGVLPTGVYLLTLSAPEITEDVFYWQNQRNLLVVADTNLVIKEMFDEVHVWATDIASGQPVAGRRLALYDARGVPLGTAVSDANGFATFRRAPRPDYLDGVIVTSGEVGAPGFGVASSAWAEGISPWQFGLNMGYSPATPTFAYLYTDRPIYRPGDTVYFKGIVRDADYGRYLPPSTRSLRIEFNPTFYVEGGSFNQSFEVLVQPDGSFDGEFVLSKDLPLGTYQFYLPGLDYDTSRSFTVAEYRRPEFLVGLTPARPEAVRGEVVEVTLEASYFFGGPAADLSVNWSVSEMAYYPDIPGPYYSYGDSANYFYRDYGPFFFGGERSNYLISGEGRTDGNGRLVITLPADLLRNVEPGSRQVAIEATVQDLSNFPVSSRATVTFHAANVYVGIKPAAYITRAGQGTAVDLNTVNWSGQNVGNQPVQVVFYERQWRSQRTADFGFYRTIWEPVDTEVARAQVTTNAQGRATASFTPEVGGSYIAVATVTDATGRQQVSSTFLWVTDNNFVGWRTDQKERRMELTLDQQTYQPGDTARVLVQSPFAGPVRAWLTIERGRLIEQRLVTLQTNSDVLEIAIPDLYAPNVYLTLTAVKPVTPGTDYPYADIRVGMVEIKVSTQRLTLNVALNARSAQFAPGETAVYDITVTDYLGRPVQATLSLALVDLAVLTLKPDNAPPIQEAFYKPLPIYSQVGSGLIVSGEGLEPELPVEGGGMGGGGGDMATEALSRALGDEEERVRRDFPDTAYWRASIVTDANGRAQVEIPLPDSLTTWRLSSKAVSSDTLVGQGSTDVIVSLPLLLRPITPRFFTVGDVVYLGAIVNNNTNSPIEATVSLAATGLSGDLTNKTVTVPANGRTLVRWQVTVEDGTEADLTFRVSGGGFSDATKPTFGVGPNNVIPIYRYDAEDIVGSAGVLEQAGRQVEAVLVPPNADLRRGTVNVTLSPSLAAALLDSLTALELESYETACAHAIASHLLPNAATARALRDLNLEPKLRDRLDSLILDQIAKIVALRLPTGGWSWCYSNEQDTYLTAYVLFALVQAANAGYEVPREVLDDGRFLLGSLVEQQPDRLTAAYELNQQIFYLYTLYLLGSDYPDLYDAYVAARRDLLSPYAKAMLAEIYHGTDYTPANLSILLNDLNDSAIFSATGTHWQDVQPYWANLESNVRNTAVVINALAGIDPQNQLLPGAIRWLMQARRAQLWETPYDTAWSIMALAGWMAKTGELEANFSYTLALNLKPEIQGTFTPQNITANERTAIPLADLVPNAINYFDFQRGQGNGRLYYTMHLNSFLLAESVSAVSRGITVQRTYYDAACNPENETCTPITQVAAGQQVRVELTIIAPNDLIYALVRDPLPAGAEAIDPNLATSASNVGPGVQRMDADVYRYGYWGWWFFNRVEFRDEEVRFYARYLPAGTYQYTYTLQASIPGAFQVMPATARQEFFPEVFGRSDGLLFTITGE